MKMRLLGASLMVFVVGSALAAEEFFVVHHPETKNCEISNSKNDGQYVLIGTSDSPTAEEAKVARDAAPECNIEIG